MATASAPSPGTMAAATAAAASPFSLTAAASPVTTPSVVSSEVPSTRSPTPPSARKHSSGEFLESLSSQVLNICLNLKDPEHPLLKLHQSPDFRNKHDALPRATNAADHHRFLGKHLAEQLDFHVEIYNTSSEVDESRGRATVYLWYLITGLAHGLEREAVAVLSWERKQGTWMLMKHIGMRGPAGFC